MGRRTPGLAAIDRRRGRGEQPVNSHQPWTSELEGQLRDTWLASVPPAAERIAELADAMGRSPGGIRSRLAKIGCDPDIPGRLLEPDEITYPSGVDLDDEHGPV